MRLKIALLSYTLMLYLSSLCYAETVPERIVSLAPSVTEILYALGLKERIVGVTEFCDYPEEAKRKPNVGGMSNPSLEAVLLLKPDIVVMTTDGNPKEFETRLKSLDIKTYVMKARRIYELAEEIRNMASVLGVKEKADSLAKEFEDELERFKRTGHKSSKKVLFIVWPEPLIVAGNGTAIDDAINLLGYKNIAGEAKTSYPKYSIEEVIRQEPNFIIIGKGHENMRRLSEGLLKRLKSTPAVRGKKVFYVSDSLYRLGPRVIKGIKELTEVLK